MKNLVDAALSYAAKGISVFPCKPRSKEPATASGFKDATRNEGRIRAWWEKNPEYNIGIPTGPINGIAVLDVDGDDGEHTLRGHGTLPGTVIVSTGAGWHHYFRYPQDGIRNSAGTLGKGLDVRGNGGYVLAPPSVHPNGGVYEWALSLDDATLAACPEWLVGAVSTPYTARRVDVSALIEEGERNNELFRVGSLLRRTYQDYDDVLTALMMHNERKCNPPLPDDEVEKIAASVMRYEPEEKVSSPNDDVGILASEVKAERVEWLWEGRIPLGKITIIDGDPGLGKSLITTDLAARLTAGEEFPSDGVDGVGILDSVGGVVLLSAEDGLADTIRPRLDIAGADTSRVIILSNADRETPVYIPDAADLIERAIDRVGARLVVVDPFMAFLSPTVNANSDQQVRQALTPFKELAERKSVAIVLIRHLNKTEARKALYRGGSSIGIIGAARVGMVVEEHPDKDDTVVLATLKNNLATKGKSLTYTVDTTQHPEIDTAIPYVRWGDTTDLKADDLFNIEGRSHSQEDRAAAWLKQLLKDGPRPQADIQALVEEHGTFSYRTVERAKGKAGVVSLKDGLNQTWRWHLQGNQDSQDSQDNQASQGAVSDSNDWWYQEPPF